MPYEEFWSGLCAAHREVEREPASDHVTDPRLQEESTQPDYMGALSRRSSHVENTLGHALVASLAQEVWKRDPWEDLQVFKSEVDSAGFDLVLSCRGITRYIQLKQSHLMGNASKYSMRLDFSLMPGACAIVMVYEASTLELKHCLFFGGEPGSPMPSIEDLAPSVAPGRRTAEGVRKVRDHYRDVPRSRFEGPLTIGQVVEKLFPA